MSVPVRRRAAQALRPPVSPSLPSPPPRPPSLHSSPSLPSPTKPPKSRLYRIPRAILPPTFYVQRDATQQHFPSKLFILTARTLSNDLINEINKGPTWLRGAYPSGTLSQKHEKRRLINYLPSTHIWRTGDETEEDHIRAEEAKRIFALQKFPILEKNNDEIDKIPTMIIVSKKRIDKRAVVRNAVSRKIWNAFDRAVQELENGPNRIPRDSARAFVFVAQKEISTTTPEVLTSEISRALVQGLSKMKKTLNSPGKDRRSFPPQHKTRNPHR